MSNNNCTFNNKRRSTKQRLDQILACSTAALSLTRCLVTQKPEELHRMPLIFGNTPLVDQGQNGNSKCNSNSKCCCLPEAVAREFPINHKAKHGTRFPREVLESLSLEIFEIWVNMTLNNLITFENSLPLSRRLDQMTFKFPSNLHYAMIPWCC